MGLTVQNEEMPGPKPNEQSLGSSWFDKPAAPPISEPSPDFERPSAAIEGDPTWALVFGALSGGAGGAAMMFVSAEIARRRGIDVDVIGTIGRGPRIFGDDPVVA